MTAVLETRSSEKPQDPTDELVAAARGLVEAASRKLEEESVHTKTPGGLDITLITLRHEDGTLIQISRRIIESHQTGDLWVKTIKTIVDDTGSPKQVRTQVELPRVLEAVNAKNINHLVVKTFPDGKVAIKPPHELQSQTAALASLNELVVSAHRVPDSQFQVQYASYNEPFPIHIHPAERMRALRSHTAPVVDLLRGQTARLRGIRTKAA